MAGPGTTFTGPIQSGTVKDAAAGSQANLGLVVLSQTITVAFGATATSNVAITLPAGSQIVDVLADTTTAWNTGGTGPAATLTVGTASGGTQYAGGVSTLATGRVRPTFTGAQLLAMSNIGTTTAVNVTVTQTATGIVLATAGSTIVTIQYIQTVQLTTGSA